MEPVTTITATWTIAKTAGEISKNLYEFGKNLKDRDAKQKLDAIADQVRDLKQLASELEDENRDLKEKLRFKGDEYEFRNPFWYHKREPNQPICAKCFATGVAGPMGEPGRSCADGSRRCLVCETIVRTGNERAYSPSPQLSSEWG